MPELPEIETIKCGIQSLTNKTIDNVIVRNSSLRIPVQMDLAKLVASQKIISITRRAKYLLLHLNHGGLIIHLGMSGSLTLVNKSTQIKKHDHVDLVFKDIILRYNDPRRFGLVVYSKNFIHEPFIKSLGVEPLEDDFNAKYLLSHLHKKKSTIKQLIMNNDIVVGVGNIYASESLFLAHISPLRTGETISKTEAQNLVKAIKYVLALAIKHGGSSLRDYVNASGDLGYFQTIHNVYGKAGKPCSKCTTPIIEVRLGQRNSFYCPSCQN